MGFCFQKLRYKRVRLKLAALGLVCGFMIKGMDEVRIKIPWNPVKRAHFFSHFQKEALAAWVGVIDKYTVVVVPLSKTGNLCLPLRHYEQAFGYLEGIDMEIKTFNKNPTK